MSWWSISLSSSILAFVTTVHAALTILRHHRSANGPRVPLLLLPSAAFTLSPWFLPSPAGLAAGLAAHVAWFMACERLAVARPHTEGAPPESGRTATGGTARPPGRRLRPKEFVPVTVLAVHDETETIRTFRMSRPDDFSFVAGQFLTVRVAVDGKAYARCYSVSSAPESAGYLEISVRRQGTVSNALHAWCTPGSVLLVRPPTGKFTYPAGDPRALVFLAGGVGITPLVSMMRHAVASEPWRRVTLIVSARSEHDVAFRDEMELLASRHPQVSLVVTVSHAQPGMACRTGRIDESLIRQTVRSPADSLFYICGPVPMIDAMRAMLAGMGVPDAQVRSEEFQPAAAIGARSAAPGVEGAEGEPAGVVARLRFTLSNRIADIPRGATLLEAAEAAGVSIPSLCRSGVCGTCKTRLVSGEVRCTSDTLDADERADHYTLPCVAWAVGDCALEA